MEWRPLTLSHQAVKFGGFKDCSSGDMLLICHVILQDHVIKGSCNFSVRIPELKSLRNFQIMKNSTFIIQSITQTSLDKK